MFSFEHVHIVFYVHMNSSRVHGCYDVWVIRIYAQCHDVLRPSVWSDDQIETKHESMFRPTVWTCYLMAHS